MSIAKPTIFKPPSFSVCFQFNQILNVQKLPNTYKFIDQSEQFIRLNSSSVSELEQFTTNSVLNELTPSAEELIKYCRYRKPNSFYYYPKSHNCSDAIIKTYFKINYKCFMFTHKLMEESNFTYAYRDLAFTPIEG